MSQLSPTDVADFALPGVGASLRGPVMPETEMPVRPFRVAAPPETSAGTRPCTLLLVAKRTQNHRPDFACLARYIRQIAPDVRPIVIADWLFQVLRPRLWLRPTLTFSPVCLRQFRALRGPVFQGNPLSKSQELQRLQEHGIPVPRWAVLTETETPDLSAFGKYVVSKPDRGGRGAEVKIRRKGRLRWSPPENSGGDRCQDLLVQEFIYTGPWPVSYRVATLFGKAIWSWRVEASHERRALRGPDVFADGATGGGMSIVSTGQGCRFELNCEPDVIALAEQAHGAFAEIPLLGVDIIREQPSGKLYVIETNSCGRTWHFSGTKGRAIQRQFGFDLEAQFDGLRKAAHILIDQTRRHAA